MKIRDLYGRFLSQIRQVFYIFTFNPLTEEGRRAIVNKLTYRASERIKDIDINDPFNSQSRNNNSQDRNTPPANRQSNAVRVAPSANPSPQAYNGSGGAIESPPPPQTPQRPNISGGGIESPYPEYRCISNNPLFCYQLQNTLQIAPKAKFCSQCSFPLALQEKQQIRGHRGIYQIKRLLGKRGMGRLYAGIGQNDNQPVEIKEYILPNRSFSNPEVVRQRQEAFMRVASIKAADGKTSDFRLLFPTEGIVDRQQKRCYLIFKGNLVTLPSLNNYLAEKGAMTALQIVSLLDQILQTLEYLHGAKFQYTSGQIQQGAIHGNINLDSVLIALKRENFFVYLCDFYFWEELFEPNRSQMSRKTISDDLKNLGSLGFYAITGRMSDPRFGQPLDPQNPQHWANVDRNLKSFILRLLGINYPFDSAKTAREALRALSLEEQQTRNLLTTDEEEQRQQQKKKPWKTLIAASVLLLILGTMGWVISSLIRKQEPVVDRSKDLVPKIADVPEIPDGDFTFTTVESGITNYAFLTKLLQAKTMNLVEEIEDRSERQLSLNHWASKDKQEAIDSIDPDRTQFAIISAFDGIEGENLDARTIAYNGLLVFVPYTSKRRPGGLAAPIEGQITLDQLRSLYTGKIKNWQELGGPDREVELFVPDRPQAIKLFEDLVLTDPTDRAVFNSLLEQGEIKQLRTLEIIRTIYQDFENKERVGGIGFGFFNQVFDQCSVYPLALVGSGDRPVQTLIESNTGDPITPKTNLCIKGGYYRVDERVFQNQSYPLAFPISVVYSDDNREEPKYQIGNKFAQMLTTAEGQCLLKKVFLVPLQPLNCNRFNAP